MALPLHEGQGRREGGDGQGASGGPALDQGRLRGCWLEKPSEGGTDLARHTDVTQPEDQVVDPILKMEEKLLVFGGLATDPQEPLLLLLQVLPQILF